MSRDPAGVALVASLAGGAFVPDPLPDQLVSLHVPFAELTGDDAESTLGGAIVTTTRAAVLGPSGAGKTSLIWHVLGRPGSRPRLAPIRVPVRVEDPGVVASPERFGRHVLQVLASGLSSEHRRALRRPEDSPRLTARALVGPPDWLARAEVGVEVSRVLQDVVEPGASQVLEVANDVVATMQARDHYPVLVIDDSDHWLGNDIAAAEAFFGTIVPHLATTWTSGLIVAVHDTYVDSGSFAPASDHLEPVRVPALLGPEAVLAILQRRADVASLEPHQVRSVVHDDALDELFQDYSRTRNVRRLVLLAHMACNIAARDGLASVDGPHVTAALARMP